MTQELNIEKFKLQIIEDFKISQKSVDNLSNILKNNKAVIAGGSVLRSQTNIKKDKKNKQDYDIYVNVKNSYNLWDQLNTLLTKYDYKIGNVFTLPPYDESFFRQNHIYGRILCNSASNSRPDIDIILVENDTPIIQVVTNFDLTVCEIWYDGISINTSDLEGIMTKKSKLRPAYTKKLLETFNPFLLKRILKYKKRGFSIELDTNNININKFIEIPPIRNNIPSNMEEWLVKKLYHQYLELGLITFWNPNRFFKAFASNALTDFTMDKLRSNIITINTISDGNMPFELIVKTSKLSQIQDYAHKEGSEIYKETIIKYIPNIDYIIHDYKPPNTFLNYSKYNESGYITDIVPDESKINLCFDPFMDNYETNINNHLQEEKDSIILVMPDSTDNGNYVVDCINREQIKNAFRDLSMIKQECNKRVSGNSIIYQRTNQPRDKKYVNLPFRFPIHVPYLQVLKLLKQKDRVYYLYNTYKKITVSVSQSVVEGIPGSAVGGNHCQVEDEGYSGFDIYHLKKCKNPQCLFQNNDINDIQPELYDNKYEIIPNSSESEDYEPVRRPLNMSDSEHDSEPEQDRINNDGSCIIS